MPNCHLNIKEASQFAVTVRSPAIYKKDQAENFLHSIYKNTLNEPWISMNGERKRSLMKFLKKAADYMDIIRDDEERPIGWAALNFDVSGYILGFKSERGLRLQQENSGTLRFREVVGVYPTLSSNPKRTETREMKGKSAQAWLTSQLDRFLPADFSNLERNTLSSSIYHFSGDPIDFATICLRTSIEAQTESVDWLTIDDFMLFSVGDAVRRTKLDDVIDEYAKKSIADLLAKYMVDSYFLILKSHTAFGPYTPYCHPFVIGNIEWSTTDKQGYTEANIDDTFCLLGCIRRRCEQCGFILTVDPVKQQWLGFRRDQRTGELQDIYEPALQVRIRPAR